MFSKKRTGKSNVIKKILLILSVCMIITGCSDPLSDTETPGTGANNGNNNTPGGRYARELWGEWIRMDTGDAWYISNNSVTVNGAGQNITNTITKESDRVIKVTGGTHDYFLYASRTATSNFTGIISDIRQAAGRAAINTSRQVLVENINNAGDSRIVQPALTDGNFEVGESIAGDEYRISFPGDPGIPPVTVKPGYSGDDIGTITLAEGVSFKVSVKPQNPQTTDMTLLYADNTVYPLYIEIVNTGTVSSAGAFISATDFGGLEYSPRDYDNIVGTILPGAARQLYFSVSCAPYEENIPSIDRKIGITIRDVNGTAWADSVQLQFHKASVEFNVKSNKQVQGVVITPNQKSYHFLCNTANSFSSSVTLPWAAEPYLVVFSGAVLENETRYSFGVNVVPGTDFLSLRDPTVHEPNNTEAQAYEMDVQEERQVMSYLHLNDIDYYRVDLGPVPPEGGGVGGGNLTVTFNASGAAGGAAPAAMNANLNANIILPGIGSLTRTGYSFGGWSVNGYGTTYAAGSLYRVTGNVTLYAVWDVVNTVTFSANGASGTAPAAVIVSQNTDITLPNEGNLSRTGYSFGGWNTAA
ncbi:MAG: InlB B-repeat-containing protein, partial [Treponema sp.]|nr:InlB B-repeat-containing protein [Treponema sp.]